MTRTFLLMAFVSRMFASELKAQERPAPDSLHGIKWPSGYEPSKSKFYVHNEVEINASPETVWNILIDALKWESWYKGARNVSFKSIGDTVLAANSVFNWETMGLRFQSVVKEYEPNRILAWESRKSSIQGYHVWLIIPNGNGCRVITDESQNGWLTFFEKTFQGKKLEKLHDVWLLELKNRAERMAH
jgi:uncharacterized protein YndB with AHSA1/START domain